MLTPTNVVSNTSLSSLAIMKSFDSSHMKCFSHTSNNDRTENEIYFALSMIYIIMPLLYSLLKSYDDRIISVIWQILQSGILDAFMSVKHYVITTLETIMCCFGSVVFSAYTIVKNGREIINVFYDYHTRKIDYSKSLQVPNYDNGYDSETDTDTDTDTEQDSDPVTDPDPDQDTDSDSDSDSDPVTDPSSNEATKEMCGEDTAEFEMIHVENELD
jgi:hypothetical protein